MPENYRESAYRILDASANRACEGLRTMEELARFILDDATLTSELKHQRHELVAALRAISRDRRLSARDTDADVGTSIQTETEYERATLATIVAAAASRTQQSLRVLEEFCKTISPTTSASIEQIRYRCYTLSADLELRVGTCDRKTRLQQCQLYALIDAGQSEEDFLGRLESLCQGDVDVFQLRDRSVDDRALIRRAQVGHAMTRRYDKLLIMNDRADLAVAADVDGVHVGQDELPVSVAREIVGGKLIGVSTHNLDQARQAERDGADYIGCGPVFPSQTKAFDEYTGTDWLTEVAAQVDLPAFAIGGVDLQNVDKIIAAGMRRIAVSGAFRNRDQASNVAQQFKARLASAKDQHDEQDSHGGC